MVETHDSHIHLSGHLHDKLSPPSSSREGCISSSLFSLISSAHARSLSSQATKFLSRRHEQQPFCSSTARWPLYLTSPRCRLLRPCVEAPTTCGWRACKSHDDCSNDRGFSYVVSRTPDSLLIAVASVTPRHGNTGEYSRRS